MNACKFIQQNGSVLSELKEPICANLQVQHINTMNSSLFPEQHNRCIFWVNRQCLIQHHGQQPEPSSFSTTNSSQQTEFSGTCSLKNYDNQSILTHTKKGKRNRET